VPGSLARRSNASGVVTAGASGASALACRARSPRGAATRALEASSQVTRR
jgi:hypothetical protein